MLGRPWPIRYRWAVPDLIAHLREMGVRRFSTMPYAHRPGMARGLCEYSRDLAAVHPGVLPTLTFYPEPDAPEYVAKALADGARVSKVHLQVGDFDPREPMLEPVWATLAEAGIPVVVHAGSGPVPGRYTGVGPVSEVLRRHPSLVAVIAHLGAPETSEFLDLMDRREQTYLDTTMSFTDFMNEMRPVSDDERARLARHGDRVVFGSDYPSIPYPYAHAVAALTRQGFDAAWMRAVLSGTATRLLDGDDAVTIGPMAGDEVAATRDLLLSSYVGGGFIAPDSPYLSSLSDVAGRGRDAEVIVARSATGAVVGTVTYVRAETPWAEIARPGEAEFRMLAVAETAEGRGVGGALVDACIDRARVDGARALVISTTPMMRRAHGLYERRGFVRTPHMDWSPRPGIDLMTYRADVSLS
jgi:GNAT superfamily N-acetyltransferase